MTFWPELIRQLAAAKSVVMLTGAGVLAESGVPTFRDAQTGLWAEFRPENLAAPRAFHRNPRLFWPWCARRRKLVAEGIEPIKESVGSVDRVLAQLIDGVRNDIRYLGAKSLAELKTGN